MMRLHFCQTWPFSHVVGQRPERGRRSVGCENRSILYRLRACGRERRGRNRDLLVRDGRRLMHRFPRLVTEIAIPAPSTAAAPATSTAISLAALGSLTRN